MGLRGRIERLEALLPEEEDHSTGLEDISDESLKEVYQALIEGREPSKAAWAECCEKGKPAGKDL